MRASFPSQQRKNDKDRECRNQHPQDIDPQRERDSEQTIEQELVGQRPPDRKQWPEM
jgi:hypothetical protein